MRYDSRLEDRDIRMKKARKLLLEGYNFEEIINKLRITENTLMMTIRGDEKYLDGLFFKKTRAISNKCKYLLNKEKEEV